MMIFAEANNKTKKLYKVAALNKWLDQYRPAEYKRPREAAMVADACKVPEE